MSAGSVRPSSVLHSGPVGISPTTERHQGSEPPATLAASPEGRCPTPDKRGYERKARAKKAMSRMRGTRRGTLEVYRCSCGVWHIGHGTKGFAQHGLKHHKKSGDDGAV